MDTRTRASSECADAQPEDDELLEFMAEPADAEDLAPRFRERLRKDLWRLVQRLYGGEAPQDGEPGAEPRSGRRR